ncbi:MAG: hypothetical protein ACJARR_000088 [Pseudophaeobacter arcticus]|jgi:hypothetical protein
MIAGLCVSRQTSAAAAAAAAALFKFRRGLWAQPVHLISCQPGALALGVAGS